MMPTMHALLESFLSQQDEWQAYLLKNWNAIVGELHTRISLEYIRGTLVIIGVHDLHWMHELSCLSRELLMAINRPFDKPKVTRVRFILSRRYQVQQRKRFAPLSPPQQQKVDSITPRSLTEHHNSALAKIDDIQLQEILRTLIQHSRS